jgi:hypothetical protein
MALSFDLMSLGETRASTVPIAIFSWAEPVSRSDAGSSENGRFLKTSVRSRARETRS